MQLANTIESGANPTGSESSQTASLQENGEESGTAKKSESDINNDSSQPNTDISSGVKESSTEELIKLLEEGSLSEVSALLRIQGRCS